MSIPANMLTYKDSVYTPPLSTCLSYFNNMGSAVTTSLGFGIKDYTITPRRCMLCAAIVGRSDEKSKCFLLT